LVVGTVVAVAEASAVVAAEQTGRIGRVPVGWIEAPGKGSFGVEMACSRRGSRYVEGLAAEAVVDRGFAVVVAAAEAAVGIGVVVAVVGLRRSPVVEVDRMHPAIVPVVSDLEVVRAMGFEEQLTVEDQMDWMEQMFVTVSFSKRGWTVAEAVEAAGIVVCPEEGS
jgi:hypothetical protein